jgi:hypothetical protein
MIESTHEWELLQDGCTVQPVQPGGVVVVLKFHSHGGGQFRRQADSYLADRLDGLDEDLSRKSQVVELVNVSHALRRTRARLGEITGELIDAHTDRAIAGIHGGDMVGQKVAEALARTAALREEDRRLKGELAALERRALDLRGPAQSTALTAAGSHLARAARDAREERAETLAELPLVLAALLDKVVILAEIESLSRLPASAAQDALARLVRAGEPVAVG